MSPRPLRRLVAVLPLAWAALTLAAARGQAQPADETERAAEPGDDGEAERAGPPTFDPRAIYAVPLGDSPRRGPASAPITVVEFSDFSCPYCNRAQATVEQLERLYPGQIRFVFRHRPLDLDLTLAAEAAAAAGLQGRFWPMHDRLFAVHGQVDRAAVELHAAQLGLDLARFRADLDGGRARAVVQADIVDGDRLGLTGTPTFFVNGRAVIGARGLSLFGLLFADELARAQRVAATGPADLYAALVADGRARADVVAPPRLARELDPDATYRVGTGLPGHSDGPDDALVTVVVWTDYECPFCARLEPTLVRLRRERPADVRVVIRHMPLTGHDGSDLAAEAAVEAGRVGALWAFHQAVFAAGGPLGRDALVELGVGAGVDRATLAAALDDHRHRDVVMADAAAGAALGASGTPTMFVNGQPLVGAVPFEQLLAVVDAKLAGARALVEQGVPAGDVYAFVTRTAVADEIGDPRRRPRSMSIAAFELGPVDREAAVLAACQAGDGDGARVVVGSMRGPRRDRVRTWCRDRGVELP